MFRSSTIIRELVLSLAKVILKHSVNYVLIGYVVVWQRVLGVACVLCAVQNGTEWRVYCVLCRMRLSHLLVSELYRFQNIRWNNKKKNI
jgi:hypothetical protein